MKPKKETKQKAAKTTTTVVEGNGTITSKTDLKSYLEVVRERLEDEQAPPVLALSAMNHVMNLPGIYEILDSENKEIARDIWLRLKQAGFQVRNPPLLFGDEE